MKRFYWSSVVINVFNIIFGSISTLGLLFEDVFFSYLYIYVILITLLLLIITFFLFIFGLFLKIKGNGIAVLGLVILFVAGYFGYTYIVVCALAPIYAIKDLRSNYKNYFHVKKSLEIYETGSTDLELESRYDTTDRYQQTTNNENK